MSRNAPDEGYKQKLFFKKANKAGKTEGDFTPLPGQSYFIRVRSEIDTNSNAIKAMYGKIRSDITYGIKKNGSFFIKFTYYLNPDYTRNMEFNPKQNLLKNLKSTEAPTRP